jgi:hypothetical protein
MKNQKSSTPRIGLSLRKRLVPHVLSKSKVLGMNPNEFVNECVEECTGLMDEDNPLDVTVPHLIEEYRTRYRAKGGPMDKRLTPPQYALVSAIDELNRELTCMRHELLSLAKDEAPRIDPATFDVIKFFRERRDALMAEAMTITMPPSRVRLLERKPGKEEPA